jgi:hypothetical protein
LPYWTQGGVAFHAPAKTISINPHTEYAVTYEKDKYTVFVEKKGDDIQAKIFPVAYSFWIDARLECVLIRAAFNKTLLRIGIDIYNGNRVSDVIIPADPKSS